uniref:Uncharacterized protein n=1 Tax=Solanum lycopersicum TaxID=4081 RepID=A0A3Q7HJR3_SOLLC
MGILSPISKFKSHCKDEMRACCCFLCCPSTVKRDVKKKTKRSRVYSLRP